ncbi:hypothetical protein GGR27_001107 [Lewinella antarctica]|uniref:Uncharacterized protein n=1 Tax=Neolewinella antarctica TaxID=442734 RepID=A0ABX0X9W0_9BACT|nr:hypothetical protein [Neolewinella antarctica]
MLICILLDIFPGRLEDLNNFAFGFTAEDAPRSSSRILEPWSVSKLKRSEGFRILQASDLKMSSSVVNLLFYFKKMDLVRIVKTKSS